MAAIESLEIIKQLRKVDRALDAVVDDVQDELDNGATFGMRQRAGKLLDARRSIKLALAEYEQARREYDSVTR